MQRIKNKNQSDPPHKPMDKLKLIFFYLVALDNPCTNLETNEDDMFLDNYLAHVIEKPNLRIPNPQYLQLFF